MADTHLAACAILHALLNTASLDAGPPDRADFVAVHAVLPRQLFELLLDWEGDGDADSEPGDNGVADDGGLAEQSMRRWA